MEYYDISEPASTPAVLVRADTTKVSKGVEEGQEGGDALQDAIFSLDKVQYQFPGKLCALQVVNNILLATVVNLSHASLILRIDLTQPDHIREYEFQPRQKGDCIRKVFQSPSTRHLILSTVHGDHYYLFHSWKKPRLLTKFRGVLVESVAWGPVSDAVDSYCTGPLLVGSKQGHIFETELVSSDEYFKKEERYFRQVFSVNEEACPIMGLSYFLFHPNKCAVIAVTPTRMYQFLGAFNRSDHGPFGELFATLDSNLGKDYQEIPSPLLHSELHVWSPLLEASGYPSLATRFAWLTGPGIYYGQLVLNQHSDSVVDQAQLLPYPHLTANEQEAPLAMGMTEFHFLILYAHSIKAIRVLTQECVYSEDIPLEQGEHVLGMSVDAMKSTYWVYTNLALYELLVVDEDRDIWKIYLKRKNFTEALRFTKSPEQRDQVLLAQADDHFAHHRYILAASHYAQASCRFDDIVLLFIAQNEWEAVQVFLSKKLQHINKTDVTQSILISTWLIEMYINRLNQVKEEIDRLECRMSHLNITSSDSGDEKKESLKQEQAVVQEEFRQFLRLYKDRFDKQVAYDLISQHGSTEDLLFLAQLQGDFDKIVQHYMNEEKWLDALDVLCYQASADSFYHHSPVLIEHVPVELVNAWIKYSHLNPKHLIPALLKYEMTSQEKTQNQGIRYLQYCIEKLNNTDPAVHNYLLSLYVRHAFEDQEERLLEFLKSQDKIYFDLQYALRLFHQHHLKLSCIHIYSAMGMYEQAVEMALEHRDIELAKINANKAEENETLQKKLWLKIAQHVISEQRDIPWVMSFLKESDLLKIEDVLGFFPDFVHVDEFKQDILLQLDQYNAHIHQLKSEMVEATKSAESIRLDIRKLRRKFAVLRNGSRCTLCRLLLLTRPFYVFPCQHTFHSDCLMNYMCEDGSSWHARRVRELRTKWLSASAPKKTGIPASVSSEKLAIAEQKNQADKLKEDLETMLSCECPLCGDFMIKSIDKPFIESDEMEPLEAWAIQ